MRALPNIVSAITADGLAVLMHQPPTATLSTLLGAAYESWLNKRAKDAHGILIAEISKGNRFSNDIEPDLFFGLLHRYLNATKQVVARRNLRLMAQVLAGSLEQDCPFQPDKLASMAELVASLTKDEIKFLAVFWSCHVESAQSPLTTIDPEITGPQRVLVSTHTLALQRLVPNIFALESEFFALSGSLSRTGLLITKTVNDGVRVEVTHRLADLVKLCDIEGISVNEL